MCDVSIYVWSLEYKWHGLAKKNESIYRGAKSLTRFFIWFQKMDCQGGCALRTPTPSFWNWRKSSTSTSTCADPGESRSPPRLTWLNGRWKFGSRTDAWNTKGRPSPRATTTKRVPKTRQRKTRKAARTASCLEDLWRRATTTTARPRTTTATPSAVAAPPAAPSKRKIPSPESPASSRPPLKWQMWSKWRWSTRQLTPRPKRRRSNRWPNLVWAAWRRRRRPHHIQAPRTATLHHPPLPCRPPPRPWQP